MVGESQCGLLGAHQPGLLTHLMDVPAVWPWADPLISLSLSLSLGFLSGSLISQNKNMYYVQQSRNTKQEKSFFGKKLVFDISEMKHESCHPREKTSALGWTF